MKLHIPLVILALLLAPAWAEEAVKETITLTSDKVASESFTETSAGNGMFYSDSNGVAFISAGSQENPYTIGSADDTHADQDGFLFLKAGLHQSRWAHSRVIPVSSLATGWMLYTSQLKMVCS